MQTNRDAQIVHWLGRIGAAAAQHVAKQFGMSDNMVYRRLSSLAADGLVERYRLLYDRPSMYVATLPGLRWQGLSRFGGYRPSPSGFEHAWHVATVAVALHAYLPFWRIVSEREIRAREADDGRLFASAYAAGFGSGVRQHRPDLAVILTGSR